MKIKCLKEKHILRQSVGRYLPPRITHRPKQPYRAPDSHSFFGRTTPDYVAELLSPRAIAAAGYFDARNVERLVSKCRASGVTGFRDNMALVVVLSTQILHHLFTKNINPVSPIPA